MKISFIRFCAFLLLADSVVLWLAGTQWVSTTVAAIAAAVLFGCTVAEFRRNRHL